MDQEIKNLFDEMKKELYELKLLQASVLRKVSAKENKRSEHKLPITYTLDEVAQILHITKKGVRKKIERGELTYIPGRIPLVTEKQLFDYFKSLQPKLNRGDLI